MQILCSTGAFTRSSDPLSHEAILRYGPQFDVDGFEVIFYPQWYAQQEDVIRALQSSGLHFPALHTEKSIGEVFGSHVHLKDHDGHISAKDGRRYLHPGEGQIDFRRFVQQLRAAAFDGALSLEARAIDHEGAVEVARIQASLQFIRNLAG